ncbi:hypothetical protein Pcinc_025611 [Petrolisthes cinctipes]|uniref:Uncharacterized protein n=1 Tax=Petrolisthes cinctipes TaxID=88211 RepID=A0AAE1F8G0_PETCI|nr:hypothetical protein Pcinc_025611 [Petrolisthes cinctipes]
MSMAGLYGLFDWLTLDSFARRAVNQSMTVGAISVLGIYGLPEMNDETGKEAVDAEAVGPAACTWLVEGEWRQRKSHCGNSKQVSPRERTPGWER